MTKTLAEYLKEYCNNRKEVFQLEKDLNLQIEEYTRVAIAQRNIELLDDIIIVINSYETVASMDEFNSFENKRE